MNGNVKNPAVLIGILLIGYLTIKSSELQMLIILSKMLESLSILHQKKMLMELLIKNG